jgi:hypothetical protein
MDVLPSKMVEMIRMTAVLMAAVVIGNWFMAEQKKNKKRGLPWYRAYLTIPGVIILGAILILPFILICVRR